MHQAYVSNRRSDKRDAPGSVFSAKGACTCFTIISNQASRARRKTCIKFEELIKSQRERIINRTDDTRRFYPHFLCNLKCRRTLLKEKKIIMLKNRAERFVIGRRPIRQRLFSQPNTRERASRSETRRGPGWREPSWGWTRLTPLCSPTPAGPEAPFESSPSLLPLARSHLATPSRRFQPPTFPFLPLSLPASLSGAF